MRSGNFCQFSCRGGAVHGRPRRRSGAARASRRAARTRTRLRTAMLEPAWSGSTSAAGRAVMGSHSPSPAAAGGCQTVSCTPQEGLYLEPLDVAGLPRRACAVACDACAVRSRQAVSAIGGSVVSKPYDCHAGCWATSTEGLWADSVREPWCGTALLIVRLAQLGHGMVGAEEDVVPALRPSDVWPSTHASCAV